MLSSNGDTTLVAGPLRNDGTRFHESVENDWFRWFLESRALYIVNRDSTLTPSVIQLSEQLQPFGVRKPYPRAFAVKPDYVVMNSDAACKLYRFRDNEVHALATYHEFRSFSACQLSPGDELLLVGMTPRTVRAKRIPHVGHDTYDVTAFGKGQLITFETQSGVTRSKESRNRDLVQRHLADLDLADLAYGIGVEAWLACVRTEARTVLIGGLMNFVPYEDDLDRLGPNPGVTDFCGIVVGEMRSIKDIKRISVHMGYSFEKALPIANDRTLLILRKGPGDDTQFFYLWSDSIEGAPQAFVFPEGIFRGKRMWFADFQYDNRVGLFGVFETYQSNLRNRTVDLFVCDDFVRWRHVHALPS